MTSDDLRRWTKEMGLESSDTGQQAADRLGISRKTYYRYLSEETDIPLSIDLACAALLERLAPYSQRENH